MVTAVRPECQACRRERAQARSNAHKGGAGLAGPLKGSRPAPGRCPHYPTVWAEGYGPGSEPPDSSAWETRPDGPV